MLHVCSSITSLFVFVRSSLKWSENSNTNSSYDCLLQVKCLDVTLKFWTWINILIKTDGYRTIAGKF